MIAGADDTEIPRRLVTSAVTLGRSIATAESLTAGLVSAAIASVPGASAVLRGGVVAYTTQVKRDVLGVPEEVLAHVVSAAVAEAMAAAVAQRLQADIGLATTGVAGPDWLDGQPPGTVWIAVADRRAATATSRLLHLAGDRSQVRVATVDAVLSLAVSMLQPVDPPDSAPRAGR